MSTNQWTLTPTTPRAVLLIQLPSGTSVNYATRFSTFPYHHYSVFSWSYDTRDQEYDEKAVTLLVLDSRIRLFLIHLTSTSIHAGLVRFNPQYLFYQFISFIWWYCCESIFRAVVHDCNCDKDWSTHNFCGSHYYQR